MHNAQCIVAGGDHLSNRGWSEATPPETLEGYLKQDAERFPDKLAVICGDEHVTYAELWSRVQRRAEALRGCYAPHKIVAIRTSQNIDFLVEYFALHLMGAVAMPLEHDIPQQRFDEISHRYDDFVAPPEVADVLFTTGTTGKSKGVMVSHDTIIAEAENLADAMPFGHDQTFIITGPLNHIGSLSKIFPVIMLGATLHILEGMKDLEAFFRAIQDAPGTVATFMVPASIRMVLQLGKRQFAELADKLEFIETGAAPMAHSDMLEVCRILPNTRMYNTYASTETGMVATYDFNDGETLVGCLGRPMKNSTFFITEEGTVACQGRTLMTGYADEPEMTAQVLRDHTLYTADLARIDEQGRLRLMGRNDDVINIGGYKVAPTEVEDAAMAFDGVKDCICICEVSPVLGNRLKLLVALDEGAALDKRALARHIASRLEPYKVPQLYEAVPAIARTFNGKLNRKHYR